MTHPCTQKAKEQCLLLLSLLLSLSFLSLPLLLLLPEWSKAFPYHHAPPPGLQLKRNGEDKEIAMNINESEQASKYTLCYPSPQSLPLTTPAASANQAANP